MVVIQDGEDKHHYIDGILLDNLNLAAKKVKDDWDFCYVVDGIERSGKSVLAQLIAKTVYPDLSVNDIVFTPKQFEEAVKASKPYQAIIYDEGFGGLNSRSAMSSTNKTLVKMMTEIGFKNLFIIIVLPSYFDLDKYVAIHRSRALFHVYTAKDLERGYFRAYNFDSKKIMYLLGKKGYNYSVVNPNFYGRFTNTWFVDKESYTKKKREATLEVQKQSKKIDEEDYKEEYISRVNDCEGLTNEQRAALLGISLPHFYFKKRQQKNENY